MAKEPAITDAQEPQDPNYRRETSEANKEKARKWFERAKQLVETRSYDYAIKCYIDGLSLWPEAVDEAHQPLRGCAAARQHTGGKKPGFTDTVKHSMTHKDPLKAMLNAEWLLAHDPLNIAYMEGLFKNANRAHCDDTAMWIGNAFRNQAEQEKKLNPKRFALLKEVYEEVGDRAQARNEFNMAVDAYRRAIEALETQRRMGPKDSALDNTIRDLSTKLTILKGKYQETGSFTGSMQNADSQMYAHDQERMVQSSDRLAELVKQAEKEVEENPGVTGKVMALIDLLCRDDDPVKENKAIGILVKEFQKANEYRYKLRADDIRLRQLLREYRAAKETGDPNQEREAKRKQLRYELTVFAERMKQYPTDQRNRFEYASRLFQAKKIDEAIPLFQMARADAKTRAHCDLYIGRCFLEKGYHGQAVDTLRKALEARDVRDDEVGKQLQYYLGRAYEANGEKVQARDTYGHLLQLDYNYRDVRDRMNGLQKA